VISGFMVSSQKVSEDLVYVHCTLRTQLLTSEYRFPLPDVPAGWKPDPTRVWKLDQSVDAPPPPPPPRPQAGNWKSTISADQRGALLGETPLPTAPRSVFDYLSQKDRDRLRALASGIPNAVPPPSVKIVIPTIDTRTAHSALKGFQPFVADAGKQARYTEYLQSQANGTECTLAPGLDQGNEAFNQELANYAKAAQIFKPVSGAMASRFTTASVVEQGPKAAEGLHQPAKSSSFLTMPESSAKEEVRLQDPPKVAAAKAGLYGPLTREKEEWYPARLLCKRFGVKDPHPDGPSAEAAAQTVAEKQGHFEAETKRLAAIAAPLTTPSTGAEDEGDASGGPARKADLSNVGLGEDETQGRDTLTYERPAMDIFKAIFASDDESEDEDEDKPAADVPVLGNAPASVKAAPAPVLAVAAAAAQLSSALDEDEQPVDLATFRPTFVSRSQREARDGGSEKTKSDKKVKEKRDKKASGRFGLVSFGDDEEGVEGPAIAPATSGNSSKRSKDKDKDKDRDHKHRKKKRHGEKRAEDQDDDAMWVEKEAPEVVKSMGTEAAAVEPTVETAAGGPRGRKRAIDFM